MIVAFVVSVAASVAVVLAQEHAGTLVPWMIRRLVRALPPPDDEHFEREWLEQVERFNRNGQALTSLVWTLYLVIGLPAMRVAAGERPLRHATAKRSIDIALSLAVIAFTAPMMLVVALVVRIASPGPVLFRQELKGKNGTLIKVWKFRTMHPPRVDYDVNADLRLISERLAERIRNGEHLERADFKEYFELSREAEKERAFRVFGIGQFLRRTAIDELPKLFNVLKGDMSLVGPRARLPSESDDQRQVHKPGITGPWVVAKREVGDYLAEMNRLDDEYASNWSLVLDLKIVFLAFIRGLTRRRPRP